MSFIGKMYSTVVNSAAHKPRTAVYQEAITCHDLYARLASGFRITCNAPFEADDRISVDQDFDVKERSDFGD